MSASKKITEMSASKKIALFAVVSVVAFSIGALCGNYYRSVIESGQGLYFFMKADGLMREGKYEAALVQAYSAVSRYDDRSIILERIGDILYCDGHPEAALLNYRLAQEEVETKGGKRNNMILSKKIGELQLVDSDHSIFEQTVKCSN